LSALSDGAFEGITIWDCAEERPPRVTIRPSPARPDAVVDTAVEQAWARLCEANPRLFDGPILSLASFDNATWEVACVRESYKRLSVQDDVPTGVTLVAVNGVVTGSDRAGRDHVLLGRRSPATRMYGGQWELAPAGGLDPPPGTELSMADLAAQLSREMVEETGINAPLTGVSAVACYRDDRARSFNIVLRARIRERIESLRTGPTEWDCDETHWLPIDAVGAFDRYRGGAVIGATRSLWRRLGWISPESHTTGSRG
jgi:ADP-ribose pyrophosphatase YjhB (NUDIX family)